MSNLKLYKILASNKYDSYDCQDGSKDSLALIASDGERSYIINYVGLHLDYWICEGGANDCFEGVEAGVWLWKGRIKSHCDYFGEHDEELDGDFRKLTDEEWELLHGGDDLWDANEWNICPEKDKCSRCGEAAGVDETGT